MFWKCINRIRAKSTSEITETMTELSSPISVECVSDEEESVGDDPRTYSPTMKHPVTEVLKLEEIPVTDPKAIISLCL